jgi:hypothetical protein
MDVGHWWLRANFQKQLLAASLLLCRVCVLLLRCPGGAFMAGHPLMYKPAYKLWMQQLAEQGIHMRVFAGACLLAAEEQ